jgi:hypothetical protein
MRDSTAQLEINPGISGDPRWELVERIVASPSFVKSPRLCSFLTYICDLSLRGRGDEINELNIGEALFDRAPNYDPSVDGIVRSHASRLRQRLEQYFTEEGAKETIRLVIPKGGYTPVFEPRNASTVYPETITWPRYTDPGSAPAKDEASVSRDQGLLWILSVALCMSLAVACFAIAYLVIHPRANGSTPVVATRHPLWGKLFAPDHPTMIVASDTGLTSLQTLTGKNVPLAEYLSGDYRTHIDAPVGPMANAASELGSRRYTSIVDLDIVTKLYQLPGIPLNRIQVRYARDLRTNDLKGGPVILLGSQEGTPWIELFEDRMNFVLAHDRQRQSFVVLNRSPRRGELSRYEADHLDPQHKGMD